MFCGAQFVNAGGAGKFLSILHFDFETRSDLDLWRCGLHVYARGGNTDVWCGAYAFDDEPVELWVPTNPLPKRVVDHAASGGEIWGHNAAFEFEIWNRVCAPRYGFPPVIVDQMVCTMAMCYAMGLPGSLENAAAALGIPEQKDLEGARIMQQMAAPKGADPATGRLQWFDEPEKRRRLYQYCAQDVVVEREIGKRVMRLSPYERRVWILDQTINARGITVDVNAIFPAISIVEQEKRRLNRAIQAASGGYIATTNAVAQIKEFLSINGVQNVEGLAKEDTADLLTRNDLPENCVQVLKIRREAGKASTAKLDAMLSGAGHDNRLRGCFQYSGANTRRWAGRRVQLHNLKRPNLDQLEIDAIIDALPKKISAEEIAAFYGPPLDVLSNCVRGFLIAAPGHQLIVNDYSAIEARVIAWLAGETRILEIFNTHGKVYEDAASRIFGRLMEQITSQERQVGKVAVLALGYQGGVGALSAMARAYSVNMGSVYEPLFSMASERRREAVEASFKTNGRRYDGISRAEYIACDLTKQNWREANSQIVKFWYDLEESAIKAVLNPGTKVVCGKVTFLVNGSFLWCRLPSGGVLCYPYPKIKKIKTPWGAEKDALTYKTEIEKKWLRTTTYGGSLAENITQAVARDLLADAMLRLEERGYPIVAHVHDEVISEVPKYSDKSVEDMGKIMCELPGWARGLPIAAGGWSGHRYRKN